MLLQATARFQITVLQEHHTAALRTALKQTGVFNFLKAFTFGFNRVNQIFIVSRGAGHHGRSSQTACRLSFPLSSAEPLACASAEIFLEPTVSVVLEHLL